MKRRRSNSQHSFAQIPSANIQRSSFDRSSGIKTTLDAAYLTPIFCDEALPGDTFHLSSELFARLATPIHPFMDNMYLDTHFFAVPIRLLWDNFQKFMGEQTDPGDSTDYLIPTVTTPAGGHALYSLADYFGIPILKENLHPSALFHRAYNLIFNEWYRDENLTDSLTVNTDDGPDAETDYEVVKRGKRHDYFTSCLPWPQKGPSVELPLGISAPVIPTGDALPIFNVAVGETASLEAGAQNLDETHLNISGQDATQFYPVSWSSTKLITDLSSATAATINQIREAFQIQRLYERDARGGTRYTEILRSHFGVISPDQRLQRPEYLGGGSTPLNMQVVPQSAESGTGPGSTPQGNLAAFGVVSANRGHGFQKSFTEHCVIIGLASIRADLNYQQGIARMFTRSTRWDYYWPALAHLGEQVVENREIFATGNAATDVLPFGYQERYAEYRYKPSIVTNLMRSDAPATLDSWHLAQDFPSLPVLDAAFIEEDPPVVRVMAVPSEPHFILDGFFTFKCARPMPMYGVPGNIDRF